MVGRWHLVREADTTDGALPPSQEQPATGQGVVWSGLRSHVGHAHVVDVGPTLRDGAPGSALAVAQAAGDEQVHHRGGPGRHLAVRSLRQRRSQRLGIQRGTVAPAEQRARGLLDAQRLGITVDQRGELQGQRALRDPRRQTLWGAPAPRSWFEEGSTFAGQAVREPRFVADVLVAD